MVLQHIDLKINVVFIYYKRPQRGQKNLFCFNFNSFELKVLKLFIINVNRLKRKENVNMFIFISNF